MLNHEHVSLYQSCYFSFLVYSVLQHLYLDYRRFGRKCKCLCQQEMRR
ncbi:hypothetical protein [Blautia phage Montmirail]|nr:hypothetical protein [Blautia phage Montmirail]